MNRTKDLTGEMFNNWTVLEFSHVKNRTYLWKCQCNCGNIRLVVESSLQNGHSKSCGCSQKPKSLVGRRFENLVVIDHKRDHERKRWFCICECDCGNVITTDAENLTNKRKTSCGCNRKFRLPEDISGVKFGNLTAIEFSYKKGKNHFWKCKCDCGTICFVSKYSMKNGHTKSCGCLKEQNHTLHEKEKITYGIWRGIRERCLSPTSKKYTHYGKRGIKICDRWLNSFENFLEDMGSAPSGMSIERKDNNGDYCPENCCWIPIHQQGWNKRNSRLVTFNGQTKCVGQWAKEFNVSYGSFYDKLKRNNWNLDKIIQIEHR